MNIDPREAWEDLSPEMRADEARKRQFRENGDWSDAVGAAFAFAVVVFTCWALWLALP